VTDIVITPMDALPAPRPFCVRRDEIAEKWIREHGAGSQHTAERTGVT
jgi:hypothetical protein